MEEQSQNEERRRRREGEELSWTERGHGVLWLWSAGVPRGRGGVEGEERG